MRQTVRSGLTRALVIGLASSPVALVGCRACAPPPPAQIPERGPYAVDDGGRPLGELQAGSSLQVAARGLEPARTYEVRLGLDTEAASAGQALSFARLTTGARGEIAPFILWYQSGVVGCSSRVKEGAALGAHRYRSFAEATEALAGHRLIVSFHPVEADPSGRRSPMTLKVDAAVNRFELPIARRTSPLLYPANDAGCLLNSVESNDAPLYARGEGFRPGETVELALVPNQRAWVVGDAIADVTGTLERVAVGSDGAFTTLIWAPQEQQRGVYDLVARRDLPGELDIRRVLRPRDIVSFGRDTAVVLSLRYPVGGPLMDIAGRPIIGVPYFEFADAFAREGDTVWGALDPTYIPVGHPGGRIAAYYVVAHRSVSGWDPGMGGDNGLTDVSGGIEIMPVKAGCINASDIPIWEPPLTLGDYDVVIDFGDTPAEADYEYTAPTPQYNPPLDFLDGADQIGLTVAEDPYAINTAQPIGRAQYSADNVLTLGGVSNVDLRAVVRYPATSAGDNTPVAAGTHPLFIIEHGNHQHCEVRCHNGDGVTPAPCPSASMCSALVPYLFNHAQCPDRTLNHMGYMNLLDILASHGIIAVSIDAYDLTGSNCLVSGWIAERGQLILKHTELWSHMHDPSTFTSYTDYLGGLFAGHVDLTKVSVSGHSRGGEASVSAFVQNTGPSTIVSVSSIAPVDFLSYTLTGAPYFVILPAGDGDVSGLSGQHIYDRAGGSADAGTKSAVYVHGANHNFFNTVWADDGDDSSPARDDYIAKADQQRLGEAYLSAFTRVGLNGETVYNDMLRGRLRFPSTAGLKAYAIHHEASHNKRESGSGAGAATALTATPQTGFTPPHVTQALQVTWTTAGVGTLTYNLGGFDASGHEVLSLRVAQSDSTTNPMSGSQDFEVLLTGGGHTKETRAARFAAIPRPYNHPYFASNPHNVMTTVRIPLHSFIVNTSNVTLNNLDSLVLRFNSPNQGELYVDDIEFSR